MAAQNQVFPAVTNTELTPAASAGFAPTGFADIPVFAGPASAGPYTPRVIGASDAAGLQATYLNGPTVKEALRTMAAVASPIVFLRLPTATVAATRTAPTITSSTLAGFGALSGTATDGADVLITISTTGTTGTSFSYTVSLDGGTTTGSPIAASTGLTIVVLGVTLTLTTGKVATLGDTIAWFQLPASSTVLPTTQTGTGSSVITVTGTPLDAYEVAFKVIVGGTIGIAGITYEVSLDYGAADPTWTSTTSLSTAVTLLLLDGPIATASTGLTLNFAAGTLVAGDMIVFNTTSPAYDSAGATSGTTKLRASNVAWTWIRFVGPIPKTLGASISTIVAAWENSAKPSWGVVDCLDRATNETLARFSARINLEWTSYESTFVGYSEGMARWTCPVNGRNNRRAAMSVCTPRAMGYPIFVDWGQFSLRALPSDVSLVDANGTTVELDANADPSGTMQGAITLRSWPGQVGIYPSGAVLPGPSGNIQRIAVRRVFNIAQIVQFGLMQDNILANFRIVKAGAKSPEIVGNLFLVDQARINRIGNDALRSAVTAQGFASSASYKVRPTPISLGGDSYKLLVDMTIGSLIYVSVVQGTAQLV